MQPPYSPNTENQTVDYGGIRWKGNPGQGWQQVGMTGQPGSDNQGYNAQGQITDPLLMQQKLNQQIIQQNQPQIAALGSQKVSLSDQYSQLLDTLKQQQGLETGFASGAANTSLGQRGIDPNSVYGQQQLGSAIQPITSQFLGLEANAQQGSIGDINSIAQQIAQLQSGNPTAAITGAGNFQSLNQQAQLLPSQIALTQGQANQARYITIPNIGVYDTTSQKVISSTGLGASGRTIIGINQ